jgi:hypothetical protein
LGKTLARLLSHHRAGRSLGRWRTSGRAGRPQAPEDLGGGRARGHAPFTRAAPLGSQVPGPPNLGSSVTWRRPGQERGGPEARFLRSSARVIPPSPARISRELLPRGRRYLGCRSGGTWRRPLAPGSGAECDERPRPAAPGSGGASVGPARHPPATRGRPAPPREARAAPRRFRPAGRAGSPRLAPPAPGSAPSLGHSLPLPVTCRLSGSTSRAEPARELCDPATRWFSKGTLTNDNDHFTECPFSASEVCTASSLFAPPVTQTVPCKEKATGPGVPLSAKAFDRHGKVLGSIPSKATPGPIFKECRQKSPSFPPKFKSQFNLFLFWWGGERMQSRASLRGPGWRQTSGSSYLSLPMLGLGA